MSTARAMRSAIPPYTGRFSMNNFRIGNTFINRTILQIAGVSGLVSEWLEDHPEFGEDWVFQT